MELFETQCLLQDLLLNGESNGRKVLVAERDGERDILLHITRPGGRQGYDEVRLKIVVND